MLTNCGHVSWWKKNLGMSATTDFAALPHRRPATPLPLSLSLRLHVLLSLFCLRLCCCIDFGRKGMSFIILVIVYHLDTADFIIAVSLFLLIQLLRDGCVQKRETDRQTNGIRETTTNRETAIQTGRQTRTERQRSYIRTSPAQVKTTAASFHSPRQSSTQHLSTSFHSLFHLTHFHLASTLKFYLPYHSILIPFH